MASKRRRKGTTYDPQGRETGRWEEEEDTAHPSLEILGDAQPTEVLMADCISLDDANVSVTRDGYLKANPRIAREGIQLYRGIECGRTDMETVRVYRPEDSVFHTDAMHSYSHLPITLDHPGVPVSPSNWRKYAVGDTGDEVVRDGGSVRVPMMLRDSAAIDAVRGGKNQLSVGYACQLEWKSGQTKDGQQYDAIQRNIRANHVAIVAAARGGPSLKIGDGDDNQLQTGDKTMTTLKTVLIDGLECEMTDAAAKWVQRTMKAMSDQLDAFKKKSDDDEEEKEKCDAATKDAMTKLEDSVKAKDAEILVLKKTIADSEMTPAKINAIVMDRLNVTNNATKLMGKPIKDADTLSTDDIRKAVCVAKLGDAVKDYDAKQFSAAFDALVAQAPKGNVIDHARTAFGTPHQSQQNQDSAATKQTAYDEMRQNLEKAHLVKPAAVVA